jgi:hypothetical protein
MEIEYHTGGDLSEGPKGWREWRGEAEMENYAARKRVSAADVNFRTAILVIWEGMTSCTPRRPYFRIFLSPNHELRLRGTVQGSVTLLSFVLSLMPRARTDDSSRQ